VPSWSCTSTGCEPKVLASGTLGRQMRTVRLCELTTIGVGGPAERLVDVTNCDELVSALAEAEAASSPVLVLGGGSNLVVCDAGFPGTVVRVRIAGWRVRSDGDRVFVEVGAGEPWQRFVEHCVGLGFSGVECLSGIPGYVGGTPVQNVGAYGQEVSRVISEVAVWDRKEKASTSLSPAQCSFGYRTSLFKRSERYVVTGVTFCLERSGSAQPLRYQELADEMGAHLGDRPPLVETAEAVLRLRRRKGMVLDAEDLDTKSAGSFFTNPVLLEAQLSELSRLAPGVPTFPAPGGTKVPAAWLVEHAGFPRGYRLGNAAISSKHALAITALPGATASEVIALAKQVRDGVEARFGVRLVPEPVLVGLDL
jgi:UDP-N-acetylmuramate dehydrogenase